MLLYHKFNMFSVALLLGLFSAVHGLAEIDPKLLARFFDNEGEGVSVMVNLAEDMSSVFSQIDSMNFSDIAERRTVLTELQQTFTSNSQAPLKSFLDLQGIDYQSFWITNQLNIPNANPSIINSIATFSGVAKIEEERQIQPDRPMKDVDTNITRSARQNGAEWGIQKIRADSAWQYNYDGRGTVVANIDSGVRWTHQALRGNWRSDYGWFDPYERTNRPTDTDGHGTHTMGTIAGSGGIGVAPGAQWIACRGGAGNNWSQSGLTRCAQWIQCPTRPDGSAQNCRMAPNVVANSWSYTDESGMTWFDDVVNSWRRSGIIPVMSSGNTGPECMSASRRYPGNKNNVISVGNTDDTDSISRSSSKGPARDGRVKPDVSAPGTRVRSAGHGGDSSYQIMSGTSMACPHTAGTIALLRQMNPGADYDRIYYALAQGANREVNTGSAQACGNQPADSWPNNAFGYGRIDALNALYYVQE